MNVTREEALPFVSYVLDDALSPHPVAELLPNAVLVGWLCGFDPVFVAVQSYLPNTTVDRTDAVDIAIDYLTELGWFAAEETAPDFIIN
jgi:hypothetical protein